MSLSAYVTEELGWFRQLGQRAESLAKRATIRELDEQRLSSPREWQAFDMADVMEQGFAQEVTTSFITPPPKDMSPRTLRVRRSKDRCRYVLCSEEGEELLLARRHPDKSQFDIHVPAGGDPAVAVGAAFTLTAHNDFDLSSSKAVARDWTLSSEQCTECQYIPQPRLGCSQQGPCRQELLQLRQTKESIGPVAIMCMEVDLPNIREDNTPEVICTRNGSLESTDRKLQLVSRRPRWNKSIGGLALGFHGRCNRTSTQNIQLDVKDDCSAGRDDLPEFLFGCIGEQEFVLDYKYPLGVAQAFAIALSTEDWVA